MASICGNRGGILLYPLRNSLLLLDLSLGRILVSVCIVDMTSLQVGGCRYLGLSGARFESATVQRTPLVGWRISGLFEFASEKLQGVVKHLGTST